MADGWLLIRVSRGGRDAGHLAPGTDGGVAYDTVLVGGQAMAAELEGHRQLVGLRLRWRAIRTSWS